MLVKICGVTHPGELAVLGQNDVDWAGLWFGIPKGSNNLLEHDFLALCEQSTSELQLIGVTLLSDLATIVRYSERAQLFGIQLHGFQTPKFVEQLRSNVSIGKLIKTLHVNDEGCIEERFIERYKDSGVDYFIIDSFHDQSEIGSTGVKVGMHVLERLVEKIGSSSVMLAGGISASTIAHYEHLNTIGFDIDTNAKVGGILNEKKVSEIMLAAKGRTL